MKNDKLLKLSAMALMATPIILNGVALYKGAVATVPLAADCWFCPEVSLHAQQTNYLCYSRGLGQTIFKVVCVSGASSPCKQTYTELFQNCPTNAPQ